MKQTLSWSVLTWKHMNILIDLLNYDFCQNSAPRPTYYICVLLTETKHHPWHVSEKDRKVSRTLFFLNINTRKKKNCQMEEES